MNRCGTANAMLLMIAVFVVIPLAGLGLLGAYDYVAPKGGYR